MASKLWVASRILGDHAAGGPFGKPLVEHTIAEIDFILEMGAKDEPDRFTFLRGGIDPKKAETEAAAAWVKTAVSPADKLQRAGLTGAQARLKAYKERQGKLSPGLKPGFSRGGKTIPNA